MPDLPEIKVPVVYSQSYDRPPLVVLSEVCDAIAAIKAHLEHLEANHGRP